MDITDVGIIRNTRFMIVDGDKAALSTGDQFLRSAGAPQVYLAPAPLVALRTLQEPRSNIDCIICAHKSGTITGLQFLQALRAGRWGGGKVRATKFILMMQRLDVAAVQVADNAGTNGYYIGELHRDAFITEIAKALHAPRVQSPLPKMQVAHVNMSGVDFIFVPMDAGFGSADPGSQQQVVGELQTMMQEQLLAGAVTPVWGSAETGMGYFAAPQYHALLAALTLDFVRSNLNRELTALRPPPYVPLSSPGSRAYADFLASQAGGAESAYDPVDLAEYRVPDEASSARLVEKKSANTPGTIGGSPPPPPAPASPDLGGQRAASRGVDGGPVAPKAPPKPDFGGPGISRPTVSPKR
jgi:CheY-like chemotaxis protein